MVAKRPRDSQRQKLYNAEGVLAQFSRPLLTVPEIQAYVDNLVKQKWFRDRYGKRIIPVKDGRGTRNAYGWHSGPISMPRWSRQEYIVLHEVCHVVSSGFDAAHGPEFAGRFATIVFYALGREAEQALLDSYAEHGVKAKY